VIETESRRTVTSLLPADRFLERDQGERDYGIDLSVECFDEGEPSGAILLAQLKGAAVGSPEVGAQSIPFDFKVDRLVRVERFSTPVLLFWCPVRADESCAWFLWLQSYIAVVLDQDVPDWRAQESVRLHIPIDNRLPDDRQLSRLRHIAGHPARTAAMGQLARTLHEALFFLEDPPRLRACFEEALGLDAIYGDPQWTWAQDQRWVAETGLRACELALRGTDPTDQELSELGWRFRSSMRPDGPERFSCLGETAQRCARKLSNTIAVYFDDRLRHTVWQECGDHDF
jgi:hypothetical protein